MLELECHVIPEPGKWYMVTYGLEVVKAQCVYYGQGRAAMRFKWGDVFRQTYEVRWPSRVLSRIPDPRWIAKIARLKRRLLGPSNVIEFPEKKKPCGP